MGLLHIIGLTAPSVPRGWMADTACIAGEVCCVLRSERERHRSGAII